MPAKSVGFFALYFALNEHEITNFIHKNNHENAKNVVTGITSFQSTSVNALIHFYK